MILRAFCIFAVALGSVTALASFGKESPMETRPLCIGHVIIDPPAAFHERDVVEPAAFNLFTLTPLQNTTEAAFHRHAKDRIDALATASTKENGLETSIPGGVLLDLPFPQDDLRQGGTFYAFLRKGAASLEAEATYSPQFVEAVRAALHELADGLEPIAGTPPKDAVFCTQTYVFTQQNRPTLGSAETRYFETDEGIILSVSSSRGFLQDDQQYPRNLVHDRNRQVGATRGKELRSPIGEGVRDGALVLFDPNKTIFAYEGVAGGENGLTLKVRMSSPYAPDATFVTLWESVLSSIRHLPALVR